MPETTPLIKAALNLRAGAGFDVYGIPGLIDGKRMLFSINDDYSIGAYINGEEEFYLMQKGIGLDLGVTELSLIHISEPTRPY